MGMTDEEIKILLTDTERLLAYSRKLRTIVAGNIKKYDGKKLYLVYILDFAIGTTDSILLLNRNHKTRDSYALARILFELWVNAQFIYTTDEFEWSEVLIAYNDVETLNAIRINVEYANGEMTEDEAERIRSGKEHLARIYKDHNEVPIVGGIKAGTNKILVYDKVKDTYRADRYVKGVSDFSLFGLFGKCKLIDATVLQGLDRGQKSTTHYKTAYKWYSQFVHSSLIGMNDYRGGISEEDPVTERDIKVELKMIFYYLSSILQLAQNKLPITELDTVQRKFKKELAAIEYGDIEKEII